MLGGGRVGGGGGAEVPQKVFCRRMASGMSFIEKAKKGGLNALMGAFQASDRFDSCLAAMTVDEIRSTGFASCSLDVGDSLSNFYQTLHGGAASTLVDVVGTMALLGVDATKPGVSVEINVSFLRAIKKNDRIRIEGEVLKMGRRLGVAEVSIFDGEGRLCVRGRHTKAFT